MDTHHADGSENAASDATLTGLSRRLLLMGGAAALAAASVPLMPAEGIVGANREATHRGEDATRCIDVHSHMIPPAYLLEAPESGVRQRIWHWTPERTIDEMQRNGVEASMLSFSTPYLWFSGVEAGRRLARLCNDYAAKLAVDYPRRFGLFAGVPPLTDTEGCMHEIEYALDTLRADGITLMTNYGGQYLGDPMFAPVMQELDRRAAIAFVHPSDPSCCPNYGLPCGFAEHPFDTARTILSLWVSDASVRWPKIRFIFSHGGGGLAMIADRVDKFGRPAQGSTGGLGDRRVYDALEFIRTLYFDTANAANPPAIAATRLIAHPERILFGSDFPYIPMEREVQNLRLAPLSPAERQAIERDNALALIPRLKNG